MWLVKGWYWWRYQTVFYTAYLRNLSLRYLKSWHLIGPDSGADFVRDMHVCLRRIYQGKSTYARKTGNQITRTSGCSRGTVSKSHPRMIFPRPQCPRPTGISFCGGMERFRWDGDGCSKKWPYPDPGSRSADSSLARTCCALSYGAKNAAL